MKLSQRKFYHREILDNNYTNSYFDVMDAIKHFLKVSKLTDVRNIRLNYIEEAYEVRTVRRESCVILIDYLSKYPLFSSKYLDFMDWKKIKEIHVSKSYKNLEYSNLLISLKNNMNTNRTYFNWDHLNKFYT